MTNMTMNMCAEKRRNCPGRSAISITVLVPVLLAMFGVFAGAFLVQQKALASTNDRIAEQSNAAEATATEVRIRAEGQKSIEKKLDTLIKDVAEIKARLRRKEPQP